MKVEMYKCNYCGKTVEDYYNKIGWISIFDGLHFHITNGRKKDGVANTERFYSGTSQLDFCSITCFLQWLYTSKNTDNKSKFKEEEENNRVIFYQQIDEEIRSLKIFI